MANRGKIIELINTNLIDIKKVIDIISEFAIQSTKNEIQKQEIQNRYENYSKADEINLILELASTNYKDFINILLNTGQDNAALELDPSTIDLVDFSRCDPSKPHVSQFSFGDPNPIEQFCVDKDKKPDSYSNAYGIKLDPVGYCYLLNNCFTTGTYKEMHRFRNIFHKLKFKVIMRKNMKADDVYEELKSLSKRDELKEHDAFVFMTISHGNAKGEIYGFDGKALKIQDLINLFNNDNCPDLRRKPKTFFLNCCRGAGDVVVLSNDDEKSAYPTDDQELIRTIKMNLPNVSDFYIIYSTLYGYVAHVDWDKGTIFGKVLADSFIDRVNFRNINGLITRANEKMEEHHQDFRQRFQIIQQGTRDLFFTQKIIKDLSTK